MDLLERYQQGDTHRVYEEIEQLGPDAMERKDFVKIEAVVTETMNRVAYNLDVIYRGLLDEKYCFPKNIRFDFEHPVLKPQQGVNRLIQKLEKSVRKYGSIPLSLKLFYQIVGSCNLAWDYESISEIPWEGADPIQIGPITDLLSEIKEMDEEDIEDGLPVSADYLHKDNISGGPQYRIELTERPQVDSRFLNEEHNTTFINYLRIALDNCGFSRAQAVRDLPGFSIYYNKVKTLLKPI